MHIARTIAEMRSIIATERTAGNRVGFVPTMGYLHQGHLSLVEISKRHADFHVMSIFVNRIQFNDKNDFDAYPIDLQRDFAMAEKIGIDAVFVPDEGEMYRDHRTFVDVELLTEHLCGAHRPGHFRGVFTVVSKLFNIVQPDVSVFGQKDIQQAITIERMVADLNFPVSIIIAPTVREPDGLAMSSRNKHLNAEHRQNALAIHRSLKTADGLITAGERDFSAIIASMKSVIEAGTPDRVDYVNAVRYADLQPAAALTGKSVIAVAAFFGTTRLIDNMIIENEKGGFSCIY